MDNLKNKAVYQWYDDNGEKPVNDLDSGIRIIEEDRTGKMTLQGYEGRIIRICESS